MGPTFFDLFEIIFKAIKASPQGVILKVELDLRRHVKSRDESFKKCYHREPSKEIFHKDRDTKWCFVVSERHRIDGKS